MIFKTVSKSVNFAEYIEFEYEVPNRIRKINQGY